MFLWSGTACLDVNGNGTCDPGEPTQDYTNAWIFDIADLVVYGWDYKNDGAKLVQVRFYPVGATKFT